MRVRLAIFALFAAAALTVAAPAPAAKPCWKAVVDDWYDDGLIEGVYPLHCYREALKHIPEDVRDYTSLADDITAAMQRASHPKRDAGDSGGGGKSHGGGGGGSGGGGGGSGGTSGGGGTAKPPTIPHPSKHAVERSSAKLGDGTSLNSLPVPLIVLGGLSLLLLGAAGGVRLYRLLQERRGPRPRHAGGP